MIDGLVCTCLGMSLYITSTDRGVRAIIGSRPILRDSDSLSLEDLRVKLNYFFSTLKCGTMSKINKNHYHAHTIYLQVDTMKKDWS